MRLVLGAAPSPRCSSLPGPAMLPGAVRYRDIGLPYLCCWRKKREGKKKRKKKSVFHQAKEREKAFRFQAEKSWKFWKSWKFLRGWILNNHGACIKTCLYTKPTQSLRFTLSGHLTLPVYCQRRYTSYHHTVTEQQKDLGAVRISVTGCRHEDMLQQGEEEEKFSTEATP